jgi:hypothetical protein
MRGEFSPKRRVGGLLICAAQYSGSGNDYKAVLERHMVQSARCARLGQFGAMQSFLSNSAHTKTASLRETFPTLET